MGNVRRFTSCRRSSRLRARIPILICFCACGGGAFAADWSVTTNLSQRFDADDNRSVVPDPPGYVVTSTSKLATTITADAPTHHFTFSHSFDYLKYAGPGATGLEDKFDFDDFSMSLTKNRKLTTYGLSASFTREPTSVTQFEDTGITTTNADQLTVSASGSVSHQINHNNSVSLSLSATNTDFTENVDGLTPFFSANSSLTWSHSFNNLTSGNISGRLSYARYEDDENSRNLIFSSTIGLSRQLTKNLSTSVNVGARVSRSEQDATMLMPSSSQVLAGFNGNLSVSYKPNSDTSLSLSLAQSLDPSASGELQNRTSLSLSLNRAINSQSSFSLGVRAAVQESASNSGGALRKTLSVSPTYTRKLTSKWNSSLGYLFRYSDTGTSTAHSNKVFVSISRAITIIP